MPQNKKSAFKTNGDWTEDKLERIRKYLPAYRHIFTKNSQARWYQTWYVDAFAGTGYVSQTAKNIERDEDVERFLKGSANIALDIDSPFDRYLFIDKKKSHYDELVKLRDNFPNIADRVQIYQGDANEYISRWCKETDWNKNRAVLFLDPFGMEVKWDLIQGIAETKGIDLWLLFPLFGINRHLTKDGIPPLEWIERLNNVFGTEDWLKDFYKVDSQLSLSLEESDVEDKLVKDTNFERLGVYFVERLRSVFAHVALKPLTLTNSTNSPLFLLCFAANNATAVKIAQDILKR